MKLHGYWRSSTSFRVRIALNLKGLDYEYVACNLLEAAHREASYLALNRQGLVPTLELDDGTYLTQSLAIIDYLDEQYPEPALLPPDPLGRARVRALAHSVALEIHPVNNLRILKYLAGPLNHPPEAVGEWFRHWVGQTFEPLEAALSANAATTEFCHGDKPTLADICLVPQVANGARFEVDMSPYPSINRIYENCMSLDAFAKASPPRQPDAP